MTVIFTFIFNGQIWNWERTVYQSNLNEAVENYLSTKALPFQLDNSVIRWKVK